MFLFECVLVAPLRLGSASRRSFKAPRGAAKFKDASPPFVLIALLGGTFARFSSLCPPSISVNRTSRDFEGKTVSFCFCLQTKIKDQPWFRGIKHNKMWSGKTPRRQGSVWCWHYREGGLFGLSWWVCWPLIKTFSKGSLMIQSLFWDPHLMIWSYMWGTKTSARVRARSPSNQRFFWSGVFIRLLSVNIGIREQTAQWLRGVRSCCSGFQRLPKVLGWSGGVALFSSSYIDKYSWVFDWI